MNDLYDLYQDLILDHNKSPRNYRRIDGACQRAEGYNPLCGDRVTVFIDIDNDIVKDIAFEGSGCAISTASASLMTESLRGKTLAQAQAIFEKFHDLVTGQNSSTSDDVTLGKLNAFSGVGRFPARVKCATLAWHTVNAAIKNNSDLVTTE